MPPTPELSDAALDGGLDRLWRLLEEAAASQAALRLLVVATAGTSGPDARTMVLRHVDRSARVLRFFTDVRSQKVAAIAAAPTVAIVGYDPGLALQVTLHGVGSITTADNDVDADWATIRPRAYRDYLAGVEMADTTNAAVIARSNFAVLTVRVDRAEWLELSHGGNMRANYRHEAGGWTGAWLV